MLDSIRCPVKTPGKLEKELTFPAEDVVWLTTKYSSRKPEWGNGQPAGEEVVEMLP